MGLLIKKLKKYLSPKGTLNREEYAVSLVVFLAIAYPISSLKIFDIYISIVLQFINFAVEPDEFDRLWNNVEASLYIVRGFFVILLLLIVFCILFNSIKRARDIGLHFVIGILAWASLLFNSFFSPLGEFGSSFNNIIFNFNLLLPFAITLLIFRSSFVPKARSTAFSVMVVVIGIGGANIASDWNLGFSGGSEVVEESATTTTPDTTKTTIADTTTGQEIISNDISKFNFEENIFPLYDDWEFQLSPINESCAENSNFLNIEVSNIAKNNLESIFSKPFDQITKKDIFNMQRLVVSGPLRSYEGPEIKSYAGLEFLTCLQYLEMGYGYDFWGRDYSFLSKLSELRLLDCSLCSQIRVEALYSLDNLEYLVTPREFRNPSMLHKLPNLQYIDAQHSVGGCSDYGLINKLENLKQIYVGGSDIANYLTINNSNYLTDSRLKNKISRSPSGKYIELLVEDGLDSFFSDFSDWTGLTGFYDRGYMAELMNMLYEEIEDNYEVVIFIGNQLGHSRTYDAQAQYISNNESGIGHPIYSSAECFGSKGKLRGNIIFPSLDAFYNAETTSYDWGDFTYMSGPLLHELLHLWGGADILPYHQVNLDKPGAGAGHFGLSTGGVLGGLDNNSLKDLGNNNYQANYFMSDGSNLNTKMSKVEKYFMGLLPRDDLGDLYAFIGDPIVLDIYCTETKGEEDVFSLCFKAERKITYTIEDLEDLFGKVEYIGNREISTLVVLVTEEKATEEEWAMLDEKLSWYIEEKEVDDEGANIFEASDGLLKLVFPNP